MGREDYRDGEKCREIDRQPSRPKRGGPRPINYTRPWKARHEKARHMRKKSIWDTEVSEGGRGQRQRGRHRKALQNREPYTEGATRKHTLGPVSKERSPDGNSPLGTGDPHRQSCAS